MEEQTMAPDFWDDRDAAQELMSKINRRREVVKAYQNTEALADEAETAVELALEENDEDFAAEAEAAARRFIKELDSLELSQLLSGEYDANDAILTLHAGTGGLEAQDWAGMLQRMYTRWAERRGFKMELLDELPADEGGIKSATLSICGLNA